jgi:homocysteine S-methyltransferase
MVGVLPLVSYKNAEFLHSKFPECRFPRRSAAHAEHTRGEAARKGASRSPGMLYAVRARVQGAYLMPPLGAELALGSGGLKG